MNISLKTQLERTTQRFVLHLQKRLPTYIQAPLDLICDIKVTRASNHYLLVLDVSGEVQVVCQRCLEVFKYTYQQTCQLAVCDTEEIAEKLMEKEECIVSSQDQIDLEEILTDNLHLFIPEKHVNVEACDGEARQLIGTKTEILATKLGLAIKNR